MNFDEQSKQFVIRKFEEVSSHPMILDGKHTHVLKDKRDNFFEYNPQLLSSGQFHVWAGSLKSSQALAYNLLSQFSNVTFEVALSALVVGAPAMLDAEILNSKTNTSQLFEVKMFEFTCFSEMKLSDRYFIADEYESLDHKTINEFITFIEKVQSHFMGKKIYGEGLKQLCCHLLGIINKVASNKEQKIYHLFCLCFDGWQNACFQAFVESYKQALSEFKVLADDFIKAISKETCIHFEGFVGTNEFIERNASKISSYAKKRYYEKQPFPSRAIP